MAQRALSRRNLFRRFVPEATKSVAQTVEQVLPELPKRRRPPGAIAERAFLAKCTRCDDCVKACPEVAIHKVADWVGIGAGTPVMVPEERACAMCDGFPCAAACKEGALVVPEAKVVVLGRVSLRTDRCLPFMGPECGACGGLCPGGVRALTLTLGRPRIDETCLGCGLCIDACPVSPKAIAMVALA